MYACHIPWVTVLGMDRWEILIPIQIYHANPSDKVS